MRKFYLSQQQDNEPVVKYALRLEEIFDQAVQLKAVRRTDTEILKKVLHAGLIRDLKHMSMYQCDKIENYDEFKRELRKIETELKEPVKETKSCKAAIKVNPQETTDLSEMKSLLHQLNERIGNLEKEKVENKYHQPASFQAANRYPFGGRSAYRGFRGRIGTSHQGRGSYRPTRPLSGTTFQGACHFCNERGHIQRYCPQNMDSNVVCYNCNEKGHRQINCPKV
ncbi:hypothetical protein DPMN_057367 [Dreissena polymorpha]|uniref:CCHC-type domain-containing protein n=1 Tax=Dreissena polymorpha TaxID=45954 RepID=A0A9D4HBV2_DREPO|nr:hypothetical protein DPMN_057367 [Dreissena polymorpha]